MKRRALQRFLGRDSEHGIALILTLAILVMVTLLVVAFAISMRVENTASKNFNDLIKARQIARGAVDQAVATLRLATTRNGATILDYVTFPGTVYDYGGTPGTATAKPLYSAAAPGAVASDTFDLNDTIHNTMWITGVGGEFPASTASQFPVGWVYVADDGTVAPPASLPMTSKPIIGRYVFWVDDEASKINLNTAGTPVLPPPLDYGTSLSNDVDLSMLLPGLNAFVGGIEATQSATGFTTIQEVKRADPVNGDYTANQFSLTTYSNDANYPNYVDDLDVFGRQRRPLFAAVNGVNPVSVASDITDTSINGAYGRMTDPATLGVIYSGSTFGTRYPVAANGVDGVKQIIANIIAYQTNPVLTPPPDSGPIHALPTYLGLAKTPYINEVQISYAISGTAPSITVQRTIFVELFYMYDGTYTTGNESIQLNNLPTIPGNPTSIGPVSIPIPLGQAFASGTYAVFTLVDPTIYTLTAPAAIPAQTALTTGPTQIEYFRGYPVLPKRLDYSSMLLPSVTLDPAGTTPVWHGAQAADPCVNDQDGDWEKYTNPFPGTLTPPNNANVWQSSNPVNPLIPPPVAYPFGADVSKAVIRTNAMQSLGELGYIHRPELFKYLTLQPGGGVVAGQIPDWAILDLFTVGNAAIPNVTGGRININSFINPSASSPTWQRLVPLKALLNTLGLPATVPSDIYADARSEKYGMANGTSAGIFDTIGEVCEIPSLIPTSATTDNARETSIRRIANLITTRSSTFTIWVTAQSIKQPSTSTIGRYNPALDAITGEVRMQVVVERYESTPGVIGSVPRFRVRYLRYL